MGKLWNILKKIFLALEAATPPVPAKDPYDPRHVIIAFHEGGHAMLAHLMGWEATTIQILPYEIYNFMGNIQYDLGVDKALLDNIENYVENPVTIMQLDQKSLNHLVELVKKRYTVVLAGPVSEIILMRNSNMQGESAYLDSPDEKMAILLSKFLTITGNFPEGYDISCQKEINAVFRQESNWNCLVELTNLLLSKPDLILNKHEIASVLYKSKKL